MSMDELLAEAARIARSAPTAPNPGRSALPDLRTLVDTAAALARAQRRANAREAARRARERAYHHRIEADAQLWHQATADDTEMDNCLLRAESVRGIEEYRMGRCVLEHVHEGKGVCQYGRCYLCANPLPKGFRRWCSNACSNEWWSNHLWRMAAAAAMKRDAYTCQRCGVSDRYVCADPTHRSGYRTGHTHSAQEEHCGKCRRRWPCKPQLVWLQQSGRTGNAPGHFPLRVFVQLEVNHKVALVGKGYGKSCRHHLDGLETLCHPCHVEVTNHQRQERIDARLPKVAEGPMLGLS